MIHPLVRDLYKRYVGELSRFCLHNDELKLSFSTRHDNTVMRTPPATKYLLTNNLLYTNSSALIIGKDYPHPDGLDYVRRKWKEALRDPQNCQLIPNNNNDVNIDKENERIIRKAVGKGRYVIREMEGTIQLKKYRTMRRRYGQVSTIVVTS